MINTITINYKGEELKVEGSYYKGTNGSYLNPPDPSEFEIDAVYYNNTEVTDLLDAFGIDWSDIEELCIEEYISRV